MYADFVAFTPRGEAVRWIEIAGDGDPVVYLHGLGCHGAASWADAATRLGRRAILVDLPGHGRSDRPRTYDYSLPSLRDAVIAVVENVAGGPVDLVGHSLGGTLAILVAAARPDLVRRCVAVEPALDRRAIAAGDIAAWSEQDFLDRGWELTLAGDPAWRRAEVRLTDPLAFLRCAVHTTDALDDSISDLLLSVRVPTTLIRGDVRHYDRSDDIARSGIPEIVLAGAQHFVMLDRPEAFARELRAALA
jgi:pimeloyl-ACP methyl ester carboxylesterase